MEEITASNMSASVLPAELLHLIFRELRGCDVAACRAVCGRWADALDTASECFWKKICSNDFKNIYQDAYNKSNLTWRELHKSLTSWTDISTAKITVRETLARDTNNFFTLKNGLIACPKYYGRSGSDILCNTIVYYDLENLEEHHRDQYDFNIDHYFENNDIILLIERDMNDYNNKHVMRVIPKMDKANVFKETVRKWHVSKGIVYYWKYTDFREELIRVNYVKDNKWEIEVILPELPDRHRVVELGHISKKQTNILTVVSTQIQEKPVRKYCVYSIVDKVEQLIYIVCDINGHYEMLKRHGFDWYKHEAVRKGSTYYRVRTYGPVIILSTTDSMRPSIQLFLKAYKPTGELYIHNVTPNNSITFPSYEVSRFAHHKNIQDIDIVETRNGHKIIVLCCARVFVISCDNVVHALP